MTAQELDAIIFYNGQYSAMRKLCLDRKLVSIEELALMNTLDVCKVIVKHFEILGVRDSGQKIIFVERDKWDAIMKSAVTLSR